MLRLVLFCLWGSVAQPCLAAPQEERVLEIGGTSEVTAKVSPAPDAYTVEVRMLPVTVFESATNARLSRLKARSFALQALARYLDASRLTVSASQVQQSGMDGKFYRLVVKFPRQGLSIDGNSTPATPPNVIASSSSKPVSPSEPKKEPPPRTGKRSSDADRFAFDRASAANVHTRKADHLDTVNRLRQLFTDDAALAERQATDDLQLFEALTAVHTQAERAFSTVLTQSKEDLLLLSAEQDEIRTAVNQARAELLTTLRATDVRFNAKKEKSS